MRPGLASCASREALRREGEKEGEGVWEQHPAGMVTLMCCHRDCHDSLGACHDRLGAGLLTSHCHQAKRRRQEGGRRQIPTWAEGEGRGAPPSRASSEHQEHPNQRGTWAGLGRKNQAGRVHQHRAPSRSHGTTFFPHMSEYFRDCA